MVAIPKDKDKPRQRAPMVTITNEQFEEITDLMVSGLSYTKACEQVGVNKGPMWSFIYRDPARQEQYARARFMQMSYKGNNVEDLGDETPDYGPDGKIDSGWVALQRFKFDVMRWQLSKELPKIYGDKVTQEISGIDGGPIESVMNINFIPPKK
jgi:predicted DNA-binding protein (UPF0251 family)